jgi:ubiquinone/menaquinone biosynthesis C-methylase UbiE
MTSWWNKNAQKRLDDFKSWVGGSDLESKKYARNYIAKKKYKSVLDCGCGIATEYYGYKEDNYEINYTGLDSCKFFVDKNRENNIEMVEAELEQPLPIEDNSFDCSYVKDVFEHLKYYETTINELIRVSKKEVIISWFIKPGDAEDQINYWEEEDLFHNVYNSTKLEEFIKSNPKVSKIEWKNVNDKETILHIKIKK